MSVLLPSLDWSEPYYSSFNNLIARINKLFKKLHEEPNVSLGVESWCFTHTGFQSDIKSWKSHNTNMLLKGQSVYSCVLLCVIAHSLLMHSFVTPESTPGMGQPRMRWRLMKGMRAFSLFPPVEACEQQSFCLIIIWSELTYSWLFAYVMQPDSCIRNQLSWACMCIRCASILPYM